MNRAGILTNLGGVGGRWAMEQPEDMASLSEFDSLAGSIPATKVVFRVSCRCAARVAGGGGDPAPPLGRNPSFSVAFSLCLASLLFTVLVSRAPRCLSSETPCPAAGGDG